MPCSTPTVDATARANAVELRHWGGAMARGAGPVGHRDVPFSITVDGPDEAPLARHATGGSFLNFLKDPARTHTAYTAADYGRLRAVKRAHDPDNVFAIGHNIPPEENRRGEDPVERRHADRVRSVGEGPPVICVPGLFQHRAFDPGTAELAARLASSFSVFHYDRRGRGDSGDTAPYAVEREVEDIGGLIDEAGGEAALYGMSSGGALALEATARGLAPSSTPPFTHHQRSIQPSQQLPTPIPHSSGRPGDAVALFMTSSGMPGEAVAQMREAPFWGGSRASRTRCPTT